MCQLCNINIEQAEAFAGTMLDTFNKASLSVMISIGHRARLFDLLKTSGEITSQEFASKNHLNERYVREWLAAMTVGKIVSYSRQNKTYQLPAEHAAFLTREAGSDNFATLFQYIPVMANVEDELLKCFKNGGGVSYDKFERFHKVMAEDSGQNFKSNLITEMIPLIDGMVEKLEKGIDVLDIGCGSGTAINTLAKVFPNSTFIGINYTDTNTTQLNTWNASIDFLLVDDLANARSSINGLNYQITEFTDTSISPNQVFYVLEEKSPQSNYWGTYIFSKSPARNNLIIQSPHSKFDTNTGKQAVYCFKNTLAKAFFINGTHRCNSDNFSSCSGTTTVCGSSDAYRMSDMAHNTTNMFQKTTENLLSNISNAVFVQLHGFGKRTTDPYVIMSNGTRETPTTDYATLLKDALLIEDNTLTFELAHINTSWTRLIGFTNTQGRLINNSTDACITSATATSGQFIHIEQEKSKLRDDANDWIKMSNAISNVFSITLSTDQYILDNRISVFPNPTSTGTFYVNGPNIDFVEIYNAFGQKIKRQINKNNSDSIFINMWTKVSGIYFLNIQTSEGKISKKIVHI